MNKKFYQDRQHDLAESNAYSGEKIKFILQETGKKKKILDIGCFDGTIGEILIKNENIVYGLDVAEENLKKAKKKGLHVTLTSPTEQKLPYGNNKFDVVLLGDVIEHIFDTDMLLSECRRVLKKNGKLILSTPNVASLGRRLMLLFGISPFLEFSPTLPTNGAVSVGHIRYYTVTNLMNQLEYNKFEKIKIRGDQLNLGFIRIVSMGNIAPSICPILLCSAIKK